MEILLTQFVLIVIIKTHSHNTGIHNMTFQTHLDRIMEIHTYREAFAACERLTGQVFWVCVTDGMGSFYVSLPQPGREEDFDFAVDYLGCREINGHYVWIAPKWR